MKKYLPFLICLLFTKISVAQYYTFLTFGYNAGMSNSKSVINTFVKDYNDTRNWLSQKMNTQEYLQGFTTSWGLGSDNIFFDFMYTNKYSLHTASGIPTGTSTLARRDVRFTFNSVSFGLYYVNFKHKNFRGPGLSFDIGKIRQRTRVGDAGNLDEANYTDVGSSNTLGLTLCYTMRIKIVKGVFLGVRPYFQVIKSTADILPLADEVNGGYTGTLTALKGGNYGLQLNIGFGTYHYDY